MKSGKYGINVFFFENGWFFFETRGQSAPSKGLGRLHIASVNPEFSISAAWDPGRASQVVQG